MKKFSHLDNKGQASMVDVSSKTILFRVAKAKGKIALLPSTIKLISANKITKGNVLTVAKIAGINAAKQTTQLIPLCHLLNLSHTSIDFTINNNSIEAESEIKCLGQTGVEMEALTAVSVALLTIYDMCKAVDKKMIIGSIKLISKTKAMVSSLDKRH